MDGPCTRHRGRVRGSGCGQPVTEAVIGQAMARSSDPAICRLFEPLGRHLLTAGRPAATCATPGSPSTCRLLRVRATCLRPARCPLDATRQEDMKKLLGEVDKDNTGTVDFEGYLQARAAARRAGAGGREG